MKVNLYRIIDRAIDEGVEYGYNRAYKHTDNPTPEQLKADIANGVMNQICEYVDFFDQYEEVKPNNTQLLREFSDEEYRPF